MSAAVRALADFLAGLDELTKATGVKLAHYERLRVQLPDEAEVHISGSPDESGHYGIEIRDNG